MGAMELLLGIADELPTEGKTSGYVKIPYPTDKSAYGFIPVPFVIVGRGVGPVALLLAGSHGDEFEGQLALAQIARELEPEEVSGRVMIFPAANPPAVRAGVRNSPIDGYSLNRIYPGDVRGTPTAVIADYIERHLMPQADFVVDLHSGGQSLNYIPCATLVAHPDPVELSRRMALALAFQAPTLLVFHGYEERNSSGAARRAGSVRIGAEIGGGSTVDAAFVEMTRNGVMNVLKWSGVVLSESSAPAAIRARSKVLRLDNRVDYVYALTGGVFEPRAQLGDRVLEGDLAGLLHDTSRPLAEPTEVHFPVAGIIVCTRAPGLTEPGDCLFQLARDFVEDFPGQLQEAESSNWVKHLYGKRRPRVRKKPA
jgi:predicted deacylase